MKPEGIRRLSLLIGVLAIPASWLFGWPDISYVNRYPQGLIAWVLAFGAGWGLTHLTAWVVRGFE